LESIEDVLPLHFIQTQEYQKGLQEHADYAIWTFHIGLGIVAGDLRVAFFHLISDVLKIK